MGSTGSSDGHEPDAVGCYYTEFPGEVQTIRDFVLALRSRLGRPRHTARGLAIQRAGAIDDHLPDPMKVNQRDLRPGPVDDDGLAGRAEADDELISLVESRDVVHRGPTQGLEPAEVVPDLRAPPVVGGLVEMVEDLGQFEPVPGDLFEPRPPGRGSAG